MFLNVTLHFAHVIHCISPLRLVCLFIRLAAKNRVHVTRNCFHLTGDEASALETVEEDAA